jgi:alpha-mannosidase
VELRLVCLQPDASTAVVRGRFEEAREANLLGEPGGGVALEGGELRLDLGPWEIRTVQLKA